MGNDHGRDDDGEEDKPETLGWFGWLAGWLVGWLVGA